MGTVECGKVDYVSYYGEITLRRKSGGTVKFGKAKNFDEEFALKDKQKLQDGDTITTGRKSFMTISGKPPDNKSQFVSIYPESEIIISTKEWKAEVKGESRAGCGISKVEVVKGIVHLIPGGAQISAPLVEIENVDKKRELSLFLDVMPGMTVVLPGSRMEVKSKATGQTCETYPAYGSIGMTELMVTGSGMYEKSMEVDERASKLGSMILLGGFMRPLDLEHEESMMGYSARKMKENKVKSEEAAKSMLTEEQIEKMKKSGKVPAAQLEMASAMAKAMKASGGAGSPAFGMNMLASMDFSKLKDMPGITPEQKKQIEDAAPRMAAMQKELNTGGKLAQLNAQANLSAKYMETAASDPVAKKKMAAMYAEMREKLDSFSLPPYPKPEERFKVK